MIRTTISNPNLFPRLFIASAAFAVSLIAANATANAQDSANSTDGSPHVARVEEDWELMIGVPDVNIAGPQILNVISPVGNIDHTHVVFELNHQSLPDFDLGGMQLQHWEGEKDIHFFNSRSFGALQIVDETIKYTMSMQLNDGVLTFQVLNGKSETWGAFGGEKTLRFSTKCALHHLDSYSPDVSLKYSRVGFAANRVRKLELKQVRLYDADGKLIRTIKDVRTLHGDSADDSTN